jgi:hypothetical protein
MAALSRAVAAGFFTTNASLAGAATMSVPLVLAAVRQRGNNQSRQEQLPTYGYFFYRFPPEARPSPCHISVRSPRDCRNGVGRSGPLYPIFLYGFGPSKFVRKWTGVWPCSVPEFTHGRKQSPEHYLHQLPTNRKSARHQMVKEETR